MRKRTKRKVWKSGGAPVLFAMRKADLVESELMGRVALARVLDHTGTAEHVATIASIALYCGRISLRLRQDDSVDAEALDAIDGVIADGADAIAAVQQRLLATGRVGCSGLEREALKRLMDAHDQIDGVASRRQSRDVMAAIVKNVLAAEGPHA